MDFIVNYNMGNIVDILKMIKVFTMLPFKVKYWGVTYG